MQATTTVSGIIPVVPTCFSECGDLDIESQAHLFQYYHRQSVGGVVLFGNASEAPSLDDCERELILRTARAELPLTTPIIVSADGPLESEMLDRCRQAKRLGAQALLVRPRSLERAATTPFVASIRRLAYAVPLPIVVSDRSYSSSAPASVDIIRRLYAELSEHISIRIEGDLSPVRISHLQDLMEDGLRVFGGANGMFMIEDLQAGAVGIMAGSDLTQVYVRIWRLCECKDWKGAWQAFRQLLPLVRFQLNIGYGPSSIKENLRACGVIAEAAVRPPTQRLDDCGQRLLKYLREMATLSDASDGDSVRYGPENRWSGTSAIAGAS